VERARKDGREAPRSRGPSVRDEARASDPELAARMNRYRELGLSDEHADILTGSRSVSDFFEAALAVHGQAPDVAAWVVNEMPHVAEGRELAALPFGGRELGRLILLVTEGRIVRLAAKEVLAEMATSGADPEDVIRRRGLEKVSADEALEPHVDAVLVEWPDKVRDYRAGKTGLLGFFVGQVARRTEGRADPVRVKALLLDKLAASAEGRAP
jgi:Asp-tRNA(Asn)/Glu-tRNA(Gln) amidotransferase B subunit